MERNFGFAVAHAYAGHTDGAGDTGSATTTYVRAGEVAAAITRLQALPALDPANRSDQGKDNTRGRGIPPARRDSRAARHDPGPEKQPQPGTLGQDTCVTKHRG